MSLAEKKCQPCRSGTPPLSQTEVASYLSQISPEWQLEGSKIRREFRFSSFPEAIAFVTQVAEIAEQEDHHPDITINYRRVRLQLTTHAAGGLTENDFILAAKIDALAART